MLQLVHDLLRRGRQNRVTVVDRDKKYSTKYSSSKKTVTHQTFWVDQGDVQLMNKTIKAEVLNLI